MKASFVDLRRKSAEIIKALQRKESVTVLYRGVPTAIMRPIENGNGSAGSSAREHASFGMWADHQDLEDVAAHVRQLRRGRFDAV